MAQAVNQRRREPSSSPRGMPVTTSPGRRWLGFASLMLGLFTILAASTSVNTAIPVLRHDFHASLSQAEWLVDSYFITFTVFLSTCGRLGDIFGRKRMFILGGILFVLGSGASALAKDVNALIAFRAFTALGPAMMMPATLSLIMDLFPLQERGLPMGLWGSLVGVAIGVGPVMGGFLVSDVSWEWVFWINVVLGLLSVAMATVLLPAARTASPGASLDVPGIVLNGGFVFTLSYALVEGPGKGWASTLIVSLLAVSALLLVLFLLRETSAGQPMLDLRLFRQPAFSAGIFVTLTLSFGLLGIFVFMPLFLQGPKGDSAISSGLTIVPLSIAMAISGPFGGFLASRVRPHWPIVAAMTFFASGMFWLAHLSLATTWQSLLLPFVIIGLGLGMASANINTAVMAAVPRQVAGAAAGLVGTVRQLGSVLGIAVLGVVLQERQSYFLPRDLRGIHTAAGQTHAANLAFTSAMNDTFLVCALVLAGGAGAAFLVRHRGDAGEQGTARAAE